MLSYERLLVVICVSASIMQCQRQHVFMLSVRVCLGCYFRDVSGVPWWIFTKLLSMVHLGTKMNWLVFWVKVKGQGSSMIKYVKNTIFRFFCDISSMH